MKRQVMQTAWAVAAHFATFAEALVYAWRVVKLRIALMVGAVGFQYRKVDGSVREATGTLRDVPATKGGAPAKGVFTYWDTVAGGWRSSRLEALIF